MSNYVKATNFTAKDGLPAGNSSKVVKGAELDTEFTAIASAVASKADSNSPTFTGTPLAPTASSGTNNTQIATTAFVNAIIPSGVIVLWSGSIASIPTGWYLCNGSNGTPDLRDRFIVGAGSTYVVGATGGSTTTTSTGSITGSTQSTTLTTDQIPSHSHISGDWRIFDATAPEYGIGSTATKTNPLGRNVTTNTAYLSNTSSTGGGQGHTHGAGTLTFNGNAVTSLPPYYALAYIMKA